REHINEKFEEHSDPIQDLGIGGIDINYEWKAVYNDHKHNLSSENIYYFWQKRLEELFIGSKVKGNFSVGNSNSYGRVQKGITTKTPVIRIELEEEKDFSLVCIQKDSWENHPEDEGEWVDPDEV